MAAGRPTKYKTEYDKQAAKLCKLGATDDDLADFFEVDDDTIAEWRKVHPTFSDSTKRAKAEFDDELVEKSLARRAQGFMRVKQVFGPEGTVEMLQEEVPPDTTACIFWLKNRKPKDWKDKQEHVHTGAVAIIQEYDPKK
jgi:hypothetical protein